MKLEIITEIFFYIWLAVLIFLCCCVIYNLIRILILSIQIHRDEKELKKLYKELAELQEERTKLETELNEMVGEE
jgi:cell division protein FtsB